MHRREFLIATSLGAAALSIASHANATPRDATAPGVVVVYEPRNAAACEFARSQAERGARIFAANECMVRLWRDTFAPIVSGGGVRIAGLTTYADFSMARECAREHGLSVLQESWHRDSPVALIQWLIGT